MRPYFLAVCKPNITAKDCLNEFGTQKFVENYVCKEKDEHILKEAVKSFFSGHAAFSFYGATFIILYLQSRVVSLKNALRHEMSTTQSLFIYNYKLLVYP